MLRALKLGRLFGIDVYVHWTFFLLPLLLHYLNLDNGGFTLPIAGLFLGVFSCVLLHEFGHALVARHFGIPTRDITIYPIGGIARLQRLSRQPWEEFWIAVAGPAVNVAIAGILLVTLIQDLLRVAVLHEFLLYLFAANLFLVGFNMAPAFPMDGGRVLRALLATRLSYLRATEWAARVGAFTSVLIALVGPWVFRNPLLIVIGIFVLFLGQLELAMVRRREAMRLTEPIDVLPADDSVISVLPPPGDPRFSGFTWDSNRSMWVQWRNGRPVQAISVEPD